MLCSLKTDETFLLFFVADSFCKKILKVIVVVVLFTKLFTILNFLVIMKKPYIASLALILIDLLIFVFHLCFGSLTISDAGSNKSANIV